MKYKTTIIFFALIIFILLGGQVNATTNEVDVTTSIGDKAMLDKGTLGFYTIEKKRSDGKWIYLTYSIIKYPDKNGKQQVAYCMDETKFGVGYVKGDVDSYEVELTKLISNEKIWRVIINGYPYKTPKELGVETEDDAYLATKRAVYAMVSGYTVEDIYINYRVGQKAINGQNLEDIQRRGEKVIKAIVNLVDIGNNGTQTLASEVKIAKVGKLEKDENNNCHFQKYKVTSSVEISEYMVEEILDFPEGTRIEDLDGNERMEFTAGEEFKIIIDDEKVKEDINGEIRVTAKCKTYPIYFGKGPEGYQDYAVCTGYWDYLETSTKLNVDSSISSLKIIKRDKDTKENLEGVKFEVRYEDGTLIGEYCTDDNGEILIKGLKPGKIIIKEIETLNGYILEAEEKEIEISFNEKKETELLNKKEPEELPVEELPQEEPIKEELESPIEPLPRTGEDGIMINIIRNIIGLTLSTGTVLFDNKIK